MKNPILFLFGSVVDFFHRIPREHPRLVCPSEASPSRAYPSRDSNGAVAPLSPEQCRAMLKELLADPESKRLLRESLVGTVFPIEGGMACPSVTGPASSSTQY